MYRRKRILHEISIEEQQQQKEITNVQVSEQRIYLNLTDNFTQYNNLVYHKYVFDTIAV